MKTHEVVIEPGRAERHYWRDLWRNRELLYILSMRDVSVRYKQTALGTAWGLIRPLTTMLIMVFVFSKIAKLPADPGVPYPLMVLGGITIWTFFSTAFTQISNSVTLNSNLVTKVYFPRLIMPISSIAVSFLDFLVSLGLFIILAIWYQFIPDWHLLLVPFFIVLAALAAFAFGLFFAVVNVRFRDIGQLIPFIVQVGFYACPIAYSSRLVAMERWYPLYILNPLVGIIDGFRWALLGEKAYFNPQSLLASVIIVGICLSLSLYFFRKRENTFVDDI
ncbi:MULTISPECIES: ABC transporter permease [Spirosoma]|uniref:Transport permease protein n=1 Tax=Spirosoma liriopis TaxID=2937440 RepID=A0ABT0HFJ9_9BACT|nr:MULTISPECIES: ABC transporter permease [Spirosoma]MCK8490923.1 ABC transporter permease [Spirosoma liriopis]UHG90308.1 ABC transporter permease [Spirosoma oryzicola]